MNVKNAVPYVNHLAEEERVETMPVIIGKITEISEDSNGNAVLNLPIKNLPVFAENSLKDFSKSLIESGMLSGKQTDKLLEKLYKDILAKTIMSALKERISNFRKM